MASIQKIQRSKGAVYKVTIRQSGNGTISKTFPLKKQAVEFARTVEGDNKLSLALGNPITRGLTLATLIDEYMQQYTGKDRGLGGQLAWWSDNYGTLSINKISASTIRDALNLLAQGKAIRGGIGERVELKRTRSGATCNRYKAHLSSIFEYGKEEYGLTENPCRDIRSKPESKGRTRFLSDDERTALLDACKNSNWDKLYLLILMALTTGARQSELMHLNHLDIDTKTRLAHLHDSKNGEQRLLPLTQEVVAIITAPKDNVISITSQPQQLGLLFPSAKKPQQPFEFRKHWNKAIADAGITSFRFHDLRHSAASWLAKNGATLQEIAEILGHKSIQMTMRYSHLCVEHKQNLIDRVMGGIK